MYKSEAERTLDGAGAAHGVQTLDEVVVAENLPYPWRHARHDPHAQQHVVGVRHLDTDLAEGRADRAHAERNHVHRAACKQTLALTHNRTNPLDQHHRLIVFRLHLGRKEIIN